VQRVRWRMILQSIPARAASALAWRLSMRAYRNGWFRLSKPSLRLTDDPVAIIVCLWNRPARLSPLLAMLDNQAAPRPIHVFLWNNQRAHTHRYRSDIADFRPAGAVKQVALVSSPINVGGLARFFIARKLWKHGYRGGFIMLDDDQDVSTSFAADLIAVDADRSITGYWAWTMRGEYWGRTPAGPGDFVSYVGTGGTICDCSLVSDIGFFTGLPRYFAFLEDIWMSGYARKHDWSLHKSATPIQFVLDETNQHHALADKKAEFYRYLRLEDPAAPDSTSGS